jgi:hypothetical protein
MRSEDKILLTEENSILLRKAMIEDDGHFLSLILCPPQQSAVPGAALNQSYSSVVLFRRKRSLRAVLFFSPLGFFQKQLAQAAVSLRIWLRPGHIIVYLWLRARLVLKERHIKAIAFQNPPNFRLIWENSEDGVAVLLNGEPWAFVCEKRSVRCSKGMLRSEDEVSIWDQGLFEQLFSTGGSTPA